MAVPNSTFSDSFVATAIARWVNDALYDLVFDRTPLLQHLKSNQKPVSDGLKINIGLEYQQPGTATNFSKGKTWVLQDREIATNAQYDWVKYGDGIAIYQEDLMKCSGDSQKINLLEAKMKQLQKGISAAINSDLWATTYTDTTKIIPLPVMIDATSTIGGINSTTYSWWQGTVEATSEAISTSRMANTYNTCYNGLAGEWPDLVVTTQTLYEGYEQLVQPYYKVETSATEGKLGFESLRFKNARLVWDVNCPSGYVVFLNTQYLKLSPHTKCATSFLTHAGSPNDQIADTKILWWMGALTCSNRASLGKQTAKTAP